VLAEEQPVQAPLQLAAALAQPTRVPLEPAPERKPAAEEPQQHAPMEEQPAQALLQLEAPQAQPARVPEVIAPEEEPAPKPKE